MLAQPGQPEHVVDQPAHPAGLQHDPLHHLVDLVGAAQRALLVELGVGAQRGQRGAQLVAGVGEEPAHLLLAGLALVQAGLDPGQHAVQRRAEPAHLAARVLRGHPVGQVAGRDPVGLAGHRLDRAQAAAQHDEDAQADEQHHRDRAGRDDELDLVDGLGHLVQVGPGDQGSAGDAQRLDPDLVPPVGTDQGVRAGPGRDLGGGGRQEPPVAAGAAVGGDLQGHLLAVERQEGHVEGAGEGGRLDVGRQHDLGGYGVAAGPGGLGGKGQGGGQPGQGQGQRSLQVAVGLGEQVAAHGGDRADVERHQREQRDDHHAGHHLEPQLGAEQPPQERRRVNCPAMPLAMTHRYPPGFPRDRLGLWGLRAAAAAGCSRRRAESRLGRVRPRPACAAGR